MPELAFPFFPSIGGRKTHYAAHAMSCNFADISALHLITVRQLRLFLKRLCFSQVGVLDGPSCPDGRMHEEARSALLLRSFCGTLYCEIETAEKRRGLRFEEAFRCM